MFCVNNRGDAIFWDPTTIQVANLGRCEPAHCVLFYPNYRATHSPMRTLCTPNEDLLPWPLSLAPPRKRPYEEQAKVSFLQRVAKDKKPGYFFAPEGVGYLFEATADSLLNAGLEFGVVDALMNRVLDGVVRSGTLSATSVAAFYHASFMETQRHERDCSPA